MCDGCVSSINQYCFEGERGKGGKGDANQKQSKKVPQMFQDL